MIFTKKNSKNFPIQSLLHILFFFAIAGCKAVGPDYEGSPEMDVPENWNNDLSNEFVAQSDTQKQWWTLLDDPILNDLIDFPSFQVTLIQVHLHSQVQPPCMILKTK